MNILLLKLKGWYYMWIQCKTSWNIEHERSVFLPVVGQTIIDLSEILKWFNMASHVIQDQFL